MRTTTIIRLAALGTTSVMLGLCAVLVGPRASVASASSGVAGFPAETVTVFETRFQNTIWPLLTRNCTQCHVSSNPSSLHFANSASQSFNVLLAGGFLDPESPTSLLAKVASPIAANRMPPAPYHQWTQAECDTLRSFCDALYAGHARTAVAKTSIFQFPRTLLAKYSGPIPRQSSDNTFLTYYQLKNKINTIFHDRWHREGVNLWEKNVAQFGGADYVTRFNESSTPSAEYLSALDTMAADVAARAYLDASGPFAGLQTDLPSPVAKMPSAAYRHNITLIYERMLFRPPTPAEMTASYRLLQAIYASKNRLNQQNSTIQFRITASSGSELVSTRECSIPLHTGPLGEVNSLVNENDCTMKSPDGHSAMKVLGTYHLVAGDRNQHLVVSNTGTNGQLVVNGILVQGPAPDGPASVTDVKTPGVVPEGAWRLEYANGVPGYTDDGAHKGECRITFPLSVKTTGKYLIAVLWKYQPGHQVKSSAGEVWTGELCSQMPITIASHDPSTAVTPAAPPIPAQGTASFQVDETDDTIAVRNFSPLFQFGSGSGLYLSNAGTHHLVAADAAIFTPEKSEHVDQYAPFKSPPQGQIQITADKADGQAGWKQYVKPDYSYFVPIGKRVVSDDNTAALKGKLHLLYNPVTAPGFNAATYYRAALSYPAAVQNDTRVPVEIRALKSSPILRITTPVSVHPGAVAQLDASGSYDVQHTPLTVSWQQIGGPRVKLFNADTLKPYFRVEPMQPGQAAWQGLCQALIRHPDFLFTRPLSLQYEKNPVVRRQLQLVKIAQDLVGRPPTLSEIAEVDHNVSLATMVNKYLKSQAFADFYFRRIRLYLESHGSTTDDEPVRLWTWIALNHKPFSQILTANYTITPDGQKVLRPAYAGHSGVLTMKGFIEGKPSLPHFNYSAQVCEKFLGYVFIVPESIIKMREGITATSTTTPGTVCFTCHQLLTPLAFQRSRYTDDGVYHLRDASGHIIDDTDHDLVPSYPYRGEGMQAFAETASRTEMFIRTMLQTHFVFFFGREMRYNRDERSLYRKLWLTEKKNHEDIEGLIKAIILSPEYLNGTSTSHPRAHRSDLHRLADNAAGRIDG